MKTFKAYLNEANYTRFLKRNKNLTSAQVKKLNDYFSKENRQAGAEIDWQTMKIATMTYNDFENIIINYKSGFKMTMKVNIPGKKGKDYYQIKLSNKKFLAYIPLNYKTAKFFNSEKFGSIATIHCIGWNSGDMYWKLHMLKEQKIPIYVIDGNGKWVITINEYNNSYEVWDKYNEKNLAMHFKEPIKGLNIEKEFFSSSLKKLYNELRKTTFIVPHFINDSIISSDARYKTTDGFINWFTGTWKGGQWLDGIWLDGTWEGGVWEKGTWEGGVWESGFWEGGYDKNGNYHGKDDSPNKWDLK